MKRIHKRIVSAFLPIPLLLAITFCCCSETDASADESVSKFFKEHHQRLEKSEHSEHQDHSRGDDECVCPKHLSFLSAHSVDIVFDSSVSQILAKNFMVNHRLENVVLLSSLSNHSQGPPFNDRLDLTVPIYLKISNLRI